MNIEKQLKGRLTFITGSAKNAGKTTFLNYALAHLGGRGTAFMSVGVDGEQHCSLTAIAKPRVAVRAGDVFVTTDAMASVSDAALEAVQAFPWKTVLGRIGVFRAGRPGFAELVGPETNGQAAEVLAFLSSLEGVDTVLVDGALNRQTQAAIAEGGVVHVAKVDAQNFTSACQQLQLLAELSAVPSPGKRRTMRVDGALTAERAAALPEDAGDVLLEDYTKNFLTLAQWRRFASGRSVYFQSPFNLRFIVPVLNEVPEKEFCRALGPRAMRLVAPNPFLERKN
ncbi:MAG: GTP-binding protein [Elusimicrobia bacterium]|nr:GTP-binding protein [Elusimicrobiota bacterium]